MEGRFFRKEDAKPLRDVDPHVHDLLTRIPIEPQLDCKRSIAYKDVKYVVQKVDDSSRGNYLVEAVPNDDGVIGLRGIILKADDNGATHNDAISLGCQIARVDYFEARTMVYFENTLFGFIGKSNHKFEHNSFAFTNQSEQTKVKNV